MAHRDIIAVGVSAGGHRALRDLAAGLPADFPAAFLVTMHLPPLRQSVLADIVDKAGPLDAAFARHGETIRPGHIYIAPPDLHMLARGGHIQLRRSPTENRMRPAIDPMFRSVGVAFGSRAIALLMTGMLSDGVAGLRAIKRCGGLTVVQDPAEAEYPELPENALARVEIDHVATIDELHQLLPRLVREAVAPSPEPPPEIRLEVAMADQEVRDIEAPGRIGERTVLTCPDCHGALWEIQDGDLVRYRCHIGHGYTMDALDEAQQGGLDEALASALRALQERVELLRRMTEDAKNRGLEGAARTWERRGREYAREAELVRDALLRQQNGNGNGSREP